MIHAVIVAELSGYDQTGSPYATIDNEADEHGAANRTGDGKARHYRPRVSCLIGRLSN